MADRATAADPRDLGALLAGVRALSVSFLPTAAQLLAKFPDDPRVATAFAGWALDPITTSSSTHAFWTAMFEVVRRLGDPRPIPTFAKRLRMKPGTPSKFWPRHDAALTKAIAMLERVPPVALAADDTRAITRLVKAATALGPIARDAAPRVVAGADATPAVPALTGPLLQQAREHLDAARGKDGAIDAARLVAAIDAMVARWREVKAAALADVIDAATTLLPAYDRPLAPGGRGTSVAKAAEAAWAEAARDPRANLPRLLDAIDRFGPKPAERWLVDVAAWPADPRIATRLAELAPMTAVGGERSGYWKALFAQIARVRDPRAAIPLAGAFAQARGQAGMMAPILAAGADFDPMQPHTWPQLAREDAGHVAALAKTIEAARRAHRAFALVAAIADAPDDPHPRQVYADWLLEREHPRGERIVLGEQVHAGTATAGERARYDELLQLAVLGALDRFADGVPFYDLTSKRVHRGLPYDVAVSQYPTTLTYRRVTEHPLVQVIHGLAFESMLSDVEPQAIADLMVAARGLERVTFAGPDRRELADRLAPLVERGYAHARDTFAFARK